MWLEMSDKHPLDVDLVIAFRATSSSSSSSKKEDAKKAEEQYQKLFKTLTDAGLKAVGRRGESLGHILVFLTCPPKLVEELVRGERHSDFISGLSVAPATKVVALSPAERIRLVHTFVSSTIADGGLGISSEAPEWDLVESIFPLHNRDFNQVWIKAWKPRNIASVQLERVRDQFGDALTFYFAFLSSYTQFLIVPAILGLAGHFLLPPYAPIYSILLSIWSIVFVEWWRVHERILSLRFGTRGSLKVEKHRPQWTKRSSWWVKELRLVASVPIILLFAAILSAILTGIFIIESFVTELYQGPGKQFITFAPTIIFAALVPRLLAVYQTIAARLTNWENHSHRSTHTSSLTLKTFALSGVVAYLGLALSAFVYVPFGEGVMRWVQACLFGVTKPSSGVSSTIRNVLNGTASTPGKDSKLVLDALAAATLSQKVGRATLWDIDPGHARMKLDPGKLRDQMFAFTVTGQVTNTLEVIALPFVLRRINAFRKSISTTYSKLKSSNASETESVSGNSSAVEYSGGSGKNTSWLKKTTFVDDEKQPEDSVERTFLDKVRAEAALPEHDLFVDYSEMVVQFGYVVLWSTIWPLAGTMAFLNNLLEMRSDAFKITYNTRRPVPCRTDTIGPWLETLTFLTWLGALTNSALVYLFSPQMLPTSNFHPTATDATAKNIAEILSESTASTAAVQKLFTSASATFSTSSSTSSAEWGVDNAMTTLTLLTARELLLKAILVALVVSHGFFLVRLLIRHIVEKIFWRGSGEVAEREREDREVKVQFLKGGGIGGKPVMLVGEVNIERDVDADESMGFWDHDEGFEEIQRISKET